MRRLLDARGLAHAPLEIARAEAIDLDGDGTDERIILIEHSGDDPGTADSDAYRLLVLSGTLAGQPRTEVITEWRGSPDDPQPETYAPHYADLNGDGVLEVLVDWNKGAEVGIDAYGLRSGRPVATGLGWYEGD